MAPWETLKWIPVTCPTRPRYLETAKEKIVIPDNFRSIGCKRTTPPRYLTYTGGLVVTPVLLFLHPDAIFISMRLKDLILARHFSKDNRYLSRFWSY
ncbi:hypothetical protein L207DRAFT_517823 [Hyaloscypha variabilis F]|uniref:Uncharacterized protein n=1 Tax=Hyaloscypha variabilis (strain UAMH 11265 / GT02V1 / F) TaxID=1149755 RepID=A0A2J6R5J3_HYAVF|nr:hypothetical protein L207DRAFT_517823 [Hyaloscypha variabilis F]